MQVIHYEQVKEKIIEIRKQQVIIDADVADLYELKQSELMRRLKITQKNFLKVT